MFPPENFTEDSEKTNEKYIEIASIETIDHMDEREEFRALDILQKHVSIVVLFP